MPTTKALGDPACRNRPAPRIDGGTGWLAAAAAFLSSFVVFGVVYSFGVFLQPVATAFGADHASVAGLFSVTAVVYYGLGVVAGRAADRIGPRPIVAAGAAILGCGLLATALADRLWVGYLTYGLGVGIGGACCYVPTLAAVGGWFEKYRNAALGVAAAGTGAGTMAVPPIAAALIERVGWRTTDAVFGIAAAALLVLSALLIRQPPAAASESRSGRSAPALLLRSRQFVLLYLSWVFGTTALFVALVFLPPFARAHGAGDVAAAGLLSLIGGTSILGRLLLGPVGDRIGVVRLFKSTVAMMAVSYAIWLASSSYAYLLIFAVILGINYGSRIAAVPAVLIEYLGMAGFGTTLGVFFTGTGVAALLGPPLAGLVVDLTGDYRGAILFALVLGVLAVAAVLPLRSQSFDRQRNTDA